MRRNVTHTISHSTALASMILFVIICLLLVFLFFLLLRLYVEKFLPQVLDETNQNPRILLAGVRLHLRRGFPVNANNNDMNLRKGLESCEISKIPQFVFQEEKQEEGQWRRHGLECVICLSSFENGQLGRRLPSCYHAYHVECIDMWLHTHTTCPVCRASAVQVSSLPEDEVGPQESEQRPSCSRKMSGEVSSRSLEVIVELPSVENQ